MTPEQQTALRTARALLDLGHPLEVILGNPLVAPELREFVRAELKREENFTLTPARILVRDPDRADWLRGLDRSTWDYWPKRHQ